MMCGFCGKERMIRAYIHMNREDVPCCFECYEEMKCKGEIYKAGKKKDEKTGKTVNWYAPTYRMVGE